MKKFYAIVLLLSAFLAVSSLYAAQKTQELDQVIAIVNDDVVTKSELDRVKKIISAQMVQSNISTLDDKTLEKETLNQLINKKLQLQMAKQIGIQVKNDDINKVIKQIASDNHLSESDLYNQLKQEGMSIKVYKKEIKEQLTLQKLQQQEVASHVSLSSEEITNFSRSKSFKTTLPKEYQIEDILIPLPDSPSNEMTQAAQKKAERILNEFNKGKNFESLAELEPKDTAAPKRINLEWRSIAELPSLFAKVVPALNPHQVAGPIKAGNGFHLVMLANVRTIGKEPALTKKQIQELVFQRKFQEALQTFVSKLRSQAFIVTNPNK